MSAELNFDRQHPLYGFIVDFCCVEHQLIIEVDGDTHAEKPKYDVANIYADLAWFPGAPVR
jgi:very-short-patch-repair endonuclease